MSPALPSILCGEGSIMTFRSCIKSAALAIVLVLVVDTVTADVVAVVSSTSTITSLSNTQVTDIFLGKVNRFPNGTLAVPIDQVEGSSARDEFYATFASKSPAQVKSLWAKIIFTGRGQPPKAVSNSTEVRKLLAANPQAIGYIERSSVDSSVKVLAQP
jgi:ABC-type phosphate transport system substrate-binding protein